MCENMKYWMRLYVARVIKGGLMAVVASFLLFCIVFGASCSKENPNNVPPVSPDAPDAPDMPGPGGVESEEDKTSPKNVISGGFSSLDSTSITLTWSEPSDTNFSKVLILRSESSISDAPTTGQDYASGVSIGASSVVYSSSETTFIDSGITASTHYFYKLFAYDMSFNYASGVEISGGGSEADPDGDGLIEIYTAKMLHNIRYNVDGTSYRSVMNGRPNSSGCPSGGCHGYELTANIDLLSLLDTGGGKNGTPNGVIDTTEVSIDKNADGDEDDAGERITVIDTSIDTSWMPIGLKAVGWRFTGTFDGNNHTIANVWVNESMLSSGIGLFGVVDGGASGTVQIRNVEIISGSIYADRATDFNFVGGLVGLVRGSLTISECTFSGLGGVFSSSAESRSGGLVGEVASFGSTRLVIINSIFSGSAGVSSYSTHSTNTTSSYGSGGLVGSSENSLVIMNSYVSGSGDISSYTKVLHSASGGLVGYSEGALTIMNSYFNGSGEIFSYSNHMFANSSSGGLVGFSEGTLPITNSYFSGSGKISSFSIALAGSNSGGLIGNGFAASITITDSYWNTDAPQSVNVAERTLENKKARGSRSSDAMGLTLAQLKSITGMHPDGLGSAWDLGTDMQLPAIKRCVSPITNGVCASYDTLLPGQR